MSTLPFQPKPSKAANRARIAQCAEQAWDKAEQALKRLDELEHPEGLSADFRTTFLRMAMWIEAFSNRGFWARLRWLFFGR